MKYLLITTLFILTTLCSYAQQRTETAAPKWAAKAQNAIVSVVAYDRDHQLLRSGTGVYVSTNGQVAVAYDVLRDAYSATVVDHDGTQHEAERLLGADSNYGMVRLQVNAKKTPALPLPTAAHAAANGATVYAINYQKGRIATCPTTTVEKKDVVEEHYAYYTLAAEMPESYNGAPLFSADGQLLGLLLSPIGGKSYAFDASFVSSLSIQAIASKSATLALNNIHLRRALPDSQEEALVYLYFQSRSASNEDYLDQLNLFVSTYPNCAEGYYRRSIPLTDLFRFDDADRDLQTFLKLSADKAAANASIAQSIYNKLLFQPTPTYDRWTYDLALTHIDRAINAVQPKAANDEASEAALLDYRLRKAQILSAKRDDAGAIAIYDDINASKHRAPATFYASSLAHEAAGDSIGVLIALMDSAIALFPSPMPQSASNYVMRRAQLLVKAGRYREAIGDYNQYCFLNGNKMTDAFYYERFQVAMEGRLYPQALDDIDKAVELAPREPLYLVEKSALLLRVNYIDESIAAARQCIAIDPENSDAYRILGYALTQKGDKVEARRMLERAKALGDEAAQEIMDKYL